MAQKKIKYNFLSKRLVEQVSAYRFVFCQNNIPQNGLKRASRTSSSGSSNFNLKPIYFSFILLFSLSACEEPEIKLDRAARRTIDTLVNYQLDSISPILDSLCKATKEDVIQHAVDSIVKERQKREERLRLNISNDE